METPQQRYQRKREIRELLAEPELEPLALGELAALELVGAHSRRESSGVSSARLDATRAALAMTEDPAEVRASRNGDRLLRAAAIRRAAVACALAQGWTMGEIGPHVGCGGARVAQLNRRAMLRPWLALRRRIWPALDRDALAELRALWAEYSRKRPHIDGTCTRKRCRLCVEFNRDSVAARGHRARQWEGGAAEREARAAYQKKRAEELRAERAEAEAAIVRMREASREELRAALAIEDEAERARAIYRFCQDWWPTERERIASGLVEPSRLARLVRDAHRQAALDAGARCQGCGGAPELTAREGSARQLQGWARGDFLCFGCADPADFPWVKGGWVAHLRDSRGWPEVAERAREQIELRKARA